MSTVSARSSTHGERRDEVVQAILCEIVSGQLRGGDRLITQHWVDSLNVSATPVREAFAVLAGLGVIDLLPNRGALVHEFSATEISDIGRVRNVLECEAVRGACGRIPPTWLREMETELAVLIDSPLKGRRDVRRAKTSDSRLHDAIRDHCANAFLIRELHRLSYLFRSFRDATWVDAETRDDIDRLKEEAAEHLEIVSALRRKESRSAVKAMEKHIRSSTRYWSRLAGKP